VSALAVWLAPWRAARQLRQAQANVTLLIGVVQALACGPEDPDGLGKPVLTLVGGGAR
jgi:hypothetical protein